MPQHPRRDLRSLAAASLSQPMQRQRRWLLLRARRVSRSPGSFCQPPGFSRAGVSLLGLEVSLQREASQFCAAARWNRELVSRVLVLVLCSNQMQLVACECVRVCLMSRCALNAVMWVLGKFGNPTTSVPERIRMSASTVGRAVFYS